MLKAYYFIIFLSLLNFVALAQSEGKKILVLGLDTNRFYSNVIAIDKFADLLEVEEDKIYQPYKSELESVLLRYREYDFNFKLVEKDDEENIRQISRFITLLNSDSVEYLAIAPADADQSPLLEIIDEYGADYYLTINLLELIAEKNDEDELESINYVIHYDLFTSDLQLIKGSVFIANHPGIWPEEVSWIFKDFALEMIFLCEAFSREGRIDENLSKIVSEYEDDLFAKKGRKGLGFTSGLNMPYGVAGVEFQINNKNSLNYNFGFGLDLAGFKIGAGLRYYLPRIKTRHTPVVGFHYNFSSGKRLELGGAKDERGFYINPDNVTRHRIHADHMISFQGGVQFYMDNVISIMPIMGYSFPFYKTEPDILSGNPPDIRNNFVRFISPGGFQFGLVILSFW